MGEQVRMRLVALHDEYVEAVNAAVAEGRDDLVDHLAQEYPDAALRILTSEAA
jgi:hypothetical protein